MEIFQRLLNVIIQFDMSTIEHEVLIIDNNSLPELEQHTVVKSFLSQKQNARVITVKQPGLTPARIVGMGKAKYDWIIFFDDDNEPAADYLFAASEIIKKYPAVGALGPGVVNVVYPNSFYEKRFTGIKDIFQFRNSEVPRFSNDQWWQDCYPAGTGLIIRKQITEAYADNVIKGVYRLADRTGKSLSSGGDLQMVLSAVKMGYKAGIHPGLSMNHHIAIDKLSISYLKKLSFGTAASNVPGHLQVWDNINYKQFAPPTSKAIVNQIYFHFKIKLFRDGYLKTNISFCAYLGALKGLYEINPTVQPSFLWKLMCKVFRLS